MERNMCLNKRLEKYEESANSRWQTTEDVLRDLSMVIGVHSIGEEYIVRGTKPPPPLPPEQDDEFELRFGSTGCGDFETHNNDFSGITEMLRMMDTVNVSPTSQDIDDGDANVKIIVTKLNPGVEAFVPRTMTASPRNEADRVNGEATTEAASKKEATVETPSMDAAVEIPSNEATAENPSKDATAENLAKEAIAQNLTEDVSAENLAKEATAENPKEAIAENPSQETSAENFAILIDKVSQKVKPFSMREKKERNVAISALMKLYAARPKSVPSSEVSTQFSNDISVSNSTLAAATENPLPEKSEEPLEASTPPKILILKTPDYFEASASAKDSDKKSEFAGHVFVEEDSKAKVDDWFERNTKQKEKELEVKEKAPPKPSMGPVMDTIVYRKKNTTPASSVQASASPSVVESPKSSNGTCPKFVPSKERDELALKYKESAAKAALKGVDMWTKLENNLKEREDLMKAGLAPSNGKGRFKAAGRRRK